MGHWSEPLVKTPDPHFPTEFGKQRGSREECRMSMALPNGRVLGLTAELQCIDNE